MEYGYSIETEVTKFVVNSPDLKIDELICGQLFKIKKKPIPFKKVILFRDSRNYQCIT